MIFTTLVQKTWVRWVAGTLAAFVLLLGLAWTAVPGLLKSQAEVRGSEVLGRKVTVGAVDFKPWTLELTVSDIRIASLDGSASQLAIERIYVNAELQSLLRLAPVIDAITVEAPHLRMAHLGAGRFDFDDVLERLKPATDAPPAAPVRFALYNLVLQGGTVDFVDRRPGGERQHQLRNLELAVPFVSNLESQRDVTVQPRLAFELNGSRFDTAAQATPFASTRKGEATLQIAKLDMAPYLPYLPAGLPLQLKGAVLDSTLKLNFTQSDKPALAVSGDITLSDIRLVDAKGADFLSVASVTAVLTELRPLEQRLALESLTITAPRLRVVRDALGKLNTNLAASPSAPAPKQASASEAVKPSQATPSAAASPAPGGWQVALAELNLRQGTVGWTDLAVPGGSNLALSDAEVQVKNIRWPLADGRADAGAAAAAMQLEGSASLVEQKAGQEKPVSGKVVKAKADLPTTTVTVGNSARVSFQGEGTVQAGAATLNVSDLGLPTLAPYVGQFLVPRAEGILGAQAQLSWNQGETALVVQRLAVEKFALTPPQTNSNDITVRELPKLGLLEVQDARIDLNAKKVAVGKVHLQTAVARLLRDEDGKWMFSQWLKTPSASTDASAHAAPAPAPALAPATNASAPATPWAVTVAEFAVDDSTLTLVDRLPAKRVFLEMQAVKLQATGFSLDGNKPMPLTLSAKIRSTRNDPGTLSFNGTVMWNPLVAQGAVDARQVPLHTVAPYFASRFNLELVRAEANFKGQFGFTQLADGPMLRVQGDAEIDDLVVKSELGVQKGSGGEQGTEELLNWKLLAVPGIDLTMVPGTPLRLKVREAALSDFYARLIINAQGRLVLQDLVRPEDTGTAAPAGGASVASASSAAASGAKPQSDARSPFIEIGPITVINGRVAFSDRFIRPNYSADLTELNGRLSQFASQTPAGVVQMADLELRGRAEGTAGLEIVGKVNPLAKPLALDVRGMVRDLELSPLSSYAIKYAGYGIERGRLSVDVNYLISPDGKLTADNKIILNQLTFGEKVEGSSSSLPVKLAVSLLSDKNGVIDLDLPISGSLNDPQFRIWPVVWKIIGNLITKALTSPFSLFSGSSGGGEESLSVVAFDPGTANISASALAGLDKVAKAMVDKPALQMTIVGSCGLEQEREAIKRERLNAMVLLEKRRAVSESGGDLTQVKAVSGAEYPELLKEAYRRSDIKKPRNLVGLRKDLPVPEMEALLLASIAVNEDTVRELARRRGVVVREYLATQQLPSSRMFLGAAKLLPQDAVQKPHAELSLTSN